MAPPVKTSMPKDVVIDSAYTVRIAALDATTGNAVANVTFSNMELEVEYRGATTPEDLAVGPFMLVPGPGA